MVENTRPALNWIPLLTAVIGGSGAVVSFNNGDQWFNRQTMDRHQTASLDSNLETRQKVQNLCKTY